MTKTDPGLSPDQAIRLTTELFSTLGVAREAADCAAFVADLQKDPLHALKWSQRHFEAITEAHVARALLQSLEKGTSVEHLATYSLEQALHGATFPQHSTSPTSNYTHQCLTAAWARAAEKLAAIVKGTIK